VRKETFLSSKMMNLPPQKKEAVGLQKFNKKCKPTKNLGPFNFIKKYLSTKVTVVVDQS